MWRRWSWQGHLYQLLILDRENVVGCTAGPDPQGVSGLLYLVLNHDGRVPAARPTITAPTGLPTTSGPLQTAVMLRYREKDVARGLLRLFWGRGKVLKLFPI